jgi:hypothetical protein
MVSYRTGKFSKCEKNKVTFLAPSGSVFFKKNEIGEHDLPQRGFGLSTPERGGTGGGNAK